MAGAFPIEGGCDCGKVRYRMLTAPLVVHCCHCRWCQRETGASFALNAMFEADRVINLGDEPEIVLTPSSSGIGQRIARCPDCKVAVWSHYPATQSIRIQDTARGPPRVPETSRFVMLGGGVRLFDGNLAATVSLERLQLGNAEQITDLRFRVVR